MNGIASKYCRERNGAKTVLSIYVLEDDFLQQTRIENAIINCVENTEVRYQSLEIFGKSNQLIEAVKSTGNHQIFFIDIEIHGVEMKGLEIAREIRERDPYAIIVFVTTHSEFMPVIFRYRVSALDFIDKGLSDKEFQKMIADVLLYAYEKVGHVVGADAFVFKTTNSHIQVPFSEILYFETSSIIHKVILKTKTRQMEFYGKVSEIARVDNRLFQVHRAYVINPENVSRLDKANHIVYFENGDSCIVSRRKQKKLVEILNQKR